MQINPNTEDALAGVSVRGWVEDITPTMPVALGAGERPGQTTTSVSEPLELNVVSVRDDVGTELIFLSFDLLYVGRQLREAVERSFSHVSADRIFVAATHTHRAPMTDDSKPRLGAVSGSYLDQVGDVLVNLGNVHRRTGGPLFRARTCASKRMTNHGINRRRLKRILISRRPAINVYVNAPNPGGFTRDEVDVVTWRADSGELTAVLWSYACHPVAFHQPNSVAAHFPHVVRQRIRDHFDLPHLPVVYLQGFSGNVRPSASTALNGLGRRLRRIMTGPIFSDMTPAVYTTWTSSLSDDVLAAVESAQPHEPVRLRSWREKVPPEGFVDGTSAPVTFQSARLANDLVVAGVSAEVVAEYVPMIESFLPGEHLLLAGCLDDTFGYAPTSQMIQEGGYEAGGYCSSFGLKGVSPYIESSMTSGFGRALAGLSQ